MQGKVSKYGSKTLGRGGLEAEGPICPAFRYRGRHLVLGDHSVYASVWGIAFR
jgi:hypothetical protein